MGGAAAAIGTGSGAVPGTSGARFGVLGAAVLNVEIEFFFNDEVRKIKFVSVQRICTSVAIVE